MRILYGPDTGKRELSTRPGSILLLALAGSIGGMAMAYLALTDRTILVFGAIVALAAVVEVDGYFPEKDHVPHNVYLTIAPEQGVPALGLPLAPLVGAAWITRRAWAHLDDLEGDAKRLVTALWVAVLAHVIVKNFADAQTSAGLTLFWMALALIVSTGRGATGRARSVVPA